DHGGLQHVEGVQGGLLTGHGLGADELVVAVVQADTGGLLDDGHGPVGTSVALDSAVIAQGAQQHLHERVAAQGSGGTEGAVGVAVDDLLLGAVGDVACEGVAHGHILKGSAAGAQSGSGGGPQDQVADDLGGGTAGQDISGLEV
ncbi:MarR family, partial [Dysosmobacter welbionis]